MVHVPQSYYHRLDYGGAVPWDINKPQPAVCRAAREWPPGSRVIDCGCGAGDNAGWLARQGHRVVGFDLSPSAISTARRRHPGIEFFEASAMEIEIDDLFDIAVDSALLHCLEDADQRAYLRRLAPLVRPAGRIFLGCFSDANPDPWDNPRRLSESHLRVLFDDDPWCLRDLQATWWERPSQRGSRTGGAWCMAWWCEIERL
ncbi:hypothetical protein CTAYLR_008757 [Chrysophaeum taylorii]|uniref:Methyltransferase domain-containing protein n=1 Tax=Chrysophaeum taylorii TaxID=2483200 RepID=A0AAD7UE81_9STRA|nr:hypothetical protein CTAYLR_008757 [Chrysophaeum taylorii]